MQGTDYEGYTVQFAKNNGSNPIRTVIYAVPPMLAYLRRDEIREKGSALINLCINMSMIAVEISLLANFTSGILVGAMPIYFSIFNIILLPWLLNDIYKDDYHDILKLAMYFFYFIFFLMESFPYYSDLILSGHVFPRWTFF